MLSVGNFSDSEVFPIICLGCASILKISSEIRELKTIAKIIISRLQLQKFEIIDQSNEIITPKACIYATSLPNFKFV